jgi:BolA protein
MIDRHDGDDYVTRMAPPPRTHDLITRKLTDAFAPHSLEVVDESDRHKGHAGHRPGGQTHFRVYIVADAFNGKTRLERHRMVNAALSGELSSGVHALAIHASAPGEPQPR